MTRITARTRSSNGQCGAVRLEFVVLDEVDAGFAQGSCVVAVSSAVKPDARLDDRADQRTVCHAGKAARAGDPEFRAGIGVRECGGQADIEEAQA